MYFVGVDQSLNHTGVFVLTDAGNVCSHVLLEPRYLSGPARLVFIRDQLKTFFGSRRMRVSVLEGYSYNSMNRKFDLGEVGAIVKLALYDCSDAVYVAAPKQLKKFVSGNASATKADVMNAIYHHWGVDIKNDNLADAYGLAQIARSVHVPRTRLRHQLDVVNEIIGAKVAKEKPARPRLSSTFKGAV